jgi:hypothetical protein
MSRKTGLLTALPLAAVVLGGAASDLQAAEPGRHPAMLPQKSAVELLHTHQEETAYQPPESIIASLQARRVAAAVARARQQKKLAQKPSVVRPRPAVPAARLLLARLVKATRAVR